ncbi:hypothetical protein PIB30_012600 [Stylosanthes scabra]|uniref:Glycerol-3-phosphate acyltransferase RAM2/GPAT1-8 HAD-like domain-containing protein n=1 Tax=Stylosanthes scabra TaxID=79078 RepID=A0ABU6X423_9FABA|nr:hypothetical protein [Stylosanthes scabra]
MEYVVFELEDTLLKDSDTFCYFMLVAFETSGLINSTLLLLLWPVIRVMERVGKGEMGKKVMIFAAVASVAKSDMESVARVMLAKFLMDDPSVKGVQLKEGEEGYGGGGKERGATIRI